MRSPQHHHNHHNHNHRSHHHYRREPNDSIAEDVHGRKSREHDFGISSSNNQSMLSKRKSTTEIHLSDDEETSPSNSKQHNSHHSHHKGKSKQIRPSFLGAEDDGLDQQKEQQHHSIGEATRKRFKAERAAAASDVARAHPAGIDDHSTASPHKASHQVIVEIHAVCGGKPTMEDRHQIIQNLLATSNEAGPPVLYVGAFDGHNGAAAAEHANDILHTHLTSSLINRLQDPPKELGTVLCESLRDAIAATEKEFLQIAKASNLHDGTTALCCVLHGDELVVANVGDTRAVIARNGKALRLSVDHKPDTAEERKRIEEVGGVVKMRGVWRVFAGSQGLAVSRSIGDLPLKTPIPAVSATPTITHQRLNREKDSIIVIATDGLWDTVTDQEAVDLVLVEMKQILHHHQPQQQQQQQQQSLTSMFIPTSSNDHQQQQGERNILLSTAKNIVSSPEVIAAHAKASSVKLVKLAMQRGSQDNITVAVVVL